jgi:hypothetical protein
MQLYIQITGQRPTVPLGEGHELLQPLRAERGIMANEDITELALQDFEWDEQKNTSNRSKHGIDFEDAIEFSMHRFYFAVLTATMRRDG